MKDTKQAIRIRRAGAKLFAQKGYSAVGVAEIGVATGLGRGALYHHMKNKEDLLYAISSDYIFVLCQAASAVVANTPDPRERLRQLCIQLMRGVGKNRHEMTVCFREIHALTGLRAKRILEIHSQYQAIWEEVIADGVATGHFRQIEKIAVKGLLGMFFYSCLWLKPGGSHTPEAIGEIFSDLVLQAISKKRALDAAHSGRKKGLRCH